MDIEEYREYEKMLAWRKLKSELDKGERSGEEHGWIDADDVRKRLGQGNRGDGSCGLQLPDRREGSPLF
jgi:hypothetical protein